MTKHAVFNALAALGYIVVVVSILNFGMERVPPPNQFIAPLAMISLFTLSAAVMGYLFCYQPIVLYFDGKKKQGVQLFLQTVLAFGCLTAGILILMFSGLFSR